MALMKNFPRQCLTLAQVHPALGLHLTSPTPSASLPPPRISRQTAATVRPTSAHFFILMAKSFLVFVQGPCGWYTVLWESAVLSCWFATRSERWP